MNRWHKLDRRLSQVLNAEEGSIMLLGVFLLIAILGFGGLAVDFSRAAELRRKLQVAADTAAREYLAGQDLETLTALCQASVTNCTVTVNSGPPSVVVTTTADYTPLFKPIYTYLGMSSAMSARARSSAYNVCTAEDPQTRTTQSTGACPAGQEGEITYEQEESRTSSCAAGATTPVWSDWAATGGLTEVSNTCTSPAKKCTYDSSRKRQYRWSESRVDTSDPCAAGQIGAKYIRVLQYREPEICPDNDEAWSDWADLLDANGKVQKSSDVQNACTSTCNQYNPPTHVEYVLLTSYTYCSSTKAMAESAKMTKYVYKYLCDGTKQFAWSEGSSASMGYSSCPIGGKAFATVGDNSWTVPDGVKNFAVVAVGGGASGSVGGAKSSTFYFNPGKTTTVGTSPAVTANGGGYDASQVSSQTYYSLPGNAGGCGGSKDGGSCGGWGGQQKSDGGAPWANYYGWKGPGGTVWFTYGGGGGGAAGYETSGASGNGGWNSGAASSSYSRTAYMTNSAHGGYGRGGGGGTQQKVTGGGGGGVGLLNYPDDGIWAKSPQGVAGGGGGSKGASAGVGTDTVITGGSTVTTAPSGGAYGGGGGGVAAPKTSTTWDEGYAGGGGELSYRNDVGVPSGQSTITITIGAGGASPDPVIRTDGTVTFAVQPGAGAAGAARIIWGDGCTSGVSRKFPDTYSKLAPFVDCPQLFCSDTNVCSWQEN